MGKGRPFVEPRLSREVASPGREGGGKAGWGTVVSTAVYNSCSFWLFCVEHTLLPRRGTQNQAPEPPFTNWA